MPMINLSDNAFFKRLLRHVAEKRLEQAHYLISKKNQRPSDVYLEVGFENLSHFSFAFKKLFGHAPTKLAAHQ